MSSLAPSKSTVYVSNLPFDLKNNDIHKLFEKHGKIVKVTVVKDKVTRRSKGVAFIQFLKREDAHKCVEATNNQDFYGRILKTSIAKDNGRSAEFIKKRTYEDKSFCYECGESGHLSYSCTTNLLGNREPPPKKKRIRKLKTANDNKQKNEDAEHEDCSDNDDEVDDETLSSAIAAEQQKREIEEYMTQVQSGNYIASTTSAVGRKKIKKSSYFSDEEESE